MLRPLFRTVSPKMVLEGLQTTGIFLLRNERNIHNSVKMLCIGTDRSQQTLHTKIRLLLKKQSDQGLRCLPLHQLLLDALMQCYIKLTNFRTIMAIV